MSSKLATEFFSWREGFYLSRTQRLTVWLLLTGFHWQFQLNSTLRCNREDAVFQVDVSVKLDSNYHDLLFTGIYIYIFFFFQIYNTKRKLLLTILVFLLQLFSNSFTRHNQFTLSTTNSNTKWPSVAYFFQKGSLVFPGCASNRFLCV